MSTFISEIIKAQAAKIDAAREEELTKRIKRYCPEYDIIDESRRIFPRVAMRKKHDGTEKWYWNDDGHPVLILTVMYLQNGDPFFYNEQQGSYNLTMNVEFI